MASSCWQLKALLIKSKLMLKRNKCSTCAELIFPVFLMILLVMVRMAFKVEDKLFEVEEKNNQNYFSNHSSYYVDSTKFNEINSNSTFNGFNSTILNQISTQISSSPLMSPILKEQIKNNMNLENFNELDSMKIRGILSTCDAANNIKIVGLIGSLSNLLENKIKDMININPHDKAYLSATLSNNNIQFKHFNSVNDMENYVKDKNYFRTDNFPRLCFAAQLDKKDDIYTMSLHYTDLLSDRKEPDVPNESLGEPYNEFQNGPDEKSFKA